MCLASLAHFNDPIVVRQLAEAVGNALSLINPGTSGTTPSTEFGEEREFVVEGAVSIIARLKEKDKRTDCLLALGSPFVLRSGQLAEVSDQIPTNQRPPFGPQEHSLALASEIRVLGTAIKVFFGMTRKSKPVKSFGTFSPPHGQRRFSSSGQLQAATSALQPPTPALDPESPEEEEDSPVQPLADLAFPVMMAILRSPRWRPDPAVIAALSFFFARIVEAVPYRIVPDLYLENLSLFESFQHKECLQVLSAGMEASVERGDDVETSEKGVEDFQKVLQEIVRIAFLLAQVGQLSPGKYMRVKVARYKGFKCEICGFFLSEWGNLPAS